MVRKAEPFELLAEIFHHVRALRFPVDQHVKPEGLLMPDDFPDGIFQESFVGGGESSPFRYSRLALRIASVCG